ncbi:MAG TPA: metallopeptidase family protein [Nitriliruptoraceae bacterium]|nr:metallopeptidase family protein [Nitriliruptoraceae bacterium]
MDRHARHRRSLPDPRRRPSPGWRAPSLEAFARLVDRGVDMLPADIRDRLDNIEITIEDVPPADYADEVLLGLYEGVPVTERTWGAAMLPDRIRLFRGPLEARAVSADDLAREVAVTVLHEIAHHFGIDDDRLDDLGWG